VCVLPIHTVHENRLIKGKRMKRNRIYNDLDKGDPICKFGPGGDFVSEWPVRGNKSPIAMENPLSKVLATIAEMIGTKIPPELLTVKDVKPDTSIKKLIKSNLEKEKQPGEKSSRTNNASSTAGTKANSKLRGQPMLFSDVRRACRTVRRKSHYRIRTYRSSSRKRTSQQFKGQGTLFEINGSSQSAA
jgi:hypothetical protein